jgi:segregation and condensation protein B
MAHDVGQPQDPVPEEGISLNELAHAFAQVMGSPPRAQPSPAIEEASSVQGGEAAPPATAESPGHGDLTADLAPDPPAENDDLCCPLSPRSILEAMLFVGDRESVPLTAVRAAELMRGVEPEDVPSVVEQLNRQYAAGQRPYCVINEGNGYRMTLRKPYDRLRERFYGRMRLARLSQTAIDILAIVAYQQPLTADQISKLRGKPSGHQLAQLVHRGLLRIERQPGKRRMAHYFTTERFLRLFGMETLADLPQSEELDRQ